MKSLILVPIFILFTGCGGIVMNAKMSGIPVIGSQNSDLLLKKIIVYPKNINLDMCENVSMSKTFLIKKGHREYWKLFLRNENMHEDINTIKITNITGPKVEYNSFRCNTKLNLNIFIDSRQKIKNCKEIKSYSRYDDIKEILYNKNAMN